MPPVSPTSGPVVVTGASGYVGAYTVLALVERGYTVHACVTNPDNPEKTAHLLAMNNQGHPGSLTLHGANLLEEGSYDVPLAGCSALRHVGTAMAYGGATVQ